MVDVRFLTQRRKESAKKNLALHESTEEEEDISRKGAKAQSAAAFLRVFFAPLRLSVRKLFPSRRRLG